MRNVSRPRLALPLAMLVAVAAVLASACSTFAGPAWKVGDVSMSVDEFFSEYEASQADASSSTTLANRADTAAVAAFMSSQIQTEIVQQIAADQGIEVTDADRSAAAQAIQSQAQQSGRMATPTDEEIVNQATITALGTKLVKDEVEAGTFDLDAEVRRVFDENEDQLPGTPPQTCMHVLFIVPGDPTSPSATAPTEEQKAEALATAEAAVARLATEDFADVSADVSVIDAQYEGGDFGCTETEQLPPDLATIAGPLEPGQVSEPVFLETDGGYVVVRVDSRTTEEIAATFEEYEERITRFVLQERTTDLVSELLRELVANLSISVDPRFGTWDSTTLSVTPPEGAATPTVPTSALAGFDPSSLRDLGVGPASTDPDGS